MYRVYKGEIIEVQIQTGQELVWLPIGCRIFYTMSEAQKFLRDALEHERQGYQEKIRELDAKRVGLDAKYGAVKDEGTPANDYDRKAIELMFGKQYPAPLEKRVETITQDILSELIRAQGEARHEIAAMIKRFTGF